MLNYYTFEVKVSTYYSVTTIAKDKSEAIENIQYDYGNRCITNHNENSDSIFEGIEDLETDTFDIVSLLDTQKAESKSD